MLEKIFMVGLGVAGGVMLANSEKVKKGIAALVEQGQQKIEASKVANDKKKPEVEFTQEDFEEFLRFKKHQAASGQPVQE